MYHFLLHMHPRLQLCFLCVTAQVVWYPCLMTVVR